MAPLFPALLLGGPPHSGKSTLTYRLSQALRLRGVAHYALRASPDGEGNWSLEAPQALVAELRLHVKQEWTPALAAQLSRDIAAELKRAHHALTEAELVLHLDRPIFPLPAHDAAHPWRPDELPLLLASLPPTTPLGLYGPGSGWLTAALAAFSAPAPQVFHALHGWVTLPEVLLSDTPEAARLNWTLSAQPGLSCVALRIPGSYLDQRAGPLLLPRLPPDDGVILEGKLPNWLWALLARTYQTCAYVACYQPQLGGSVVISSRIPAPSLGQVIAARASS